ncbi:hypothetical protein TRFO_29675 [Tritrichomonas foetus]|uniref:Uncharacterized protein n=1 Tax=Tritrichomonas foetus TaxID=1144522 RepID=A0A1J4JVI6_9EUKA|nr:hypothetical protein TRFO_29675 [Tritrichomonas foetus]|eukprot:OHT03019.1 hypothetical protein TRFO_29675 [Tritrichomonas foetus]
MKRKKWCKKDVKKIFGITKTFLIVQMYGLKQRRLEKDRLEWYKCHGQKPPNSICDDNIRRKPNTKADTQTYTKTTILNVYAPKQSDFRGPLSYWEGEGAGIEPDEFYQCIRSLRGTGIVSKEHIPVPKSTGRINDCFTPYENDLMTFDAFESARKELKRRTEHIANEMDRVYKEWTRPPDDKWFCLKDRQFSVEHSRFMELKRRKEAKFNQQQMEQQQKLYRKIGAS